jgi:hypothetical protein
MVDVRQCCSERLEFSSFSESSQMAGILQTAVFCESCRNSSVSLHFESQVSILKFR